MKVGFIDYYLDEWHANNYPAMLSKASEGQIQLTCAYAKIDSPLGGLTTPEWCKKHNARHCRTIQEVVEHSDVLVVLSPDHCEMHEELCQLPLKSGKPTYVDKTFAPDKATAQRLFKLAQQHSTPCYSASALRNATEFKPMQEQKVTSVIAVGPNGYETYSIHLLEPIMMLMQGQVARVLASGQDNWSSLLIEFEDGRKASATCTGADTPFSFTVCAGEKGSSCIVESDFFSGFIRNLATFFNTGVPPVSPEETIAIMQLRQAGSKALQTPGVWVSGKT